MAKNEFKLEFTSYIKPMSDFALQIAQEVGADPLLCMIASLLHRWAEGKTGEFRSNQANSILRECGVDAKSTNRINDIINHLLPQTQPLQKSLEEQVVADAYILTYWQNFSGYDEIKFNFEISDKIFQNIDK